MAIDVQDNLRRVRDRASRAGGTGNTFLDDIAGQIAAGQSRAASSAAPIGQVAQQRALPAAQTAFGALGSGGSAGAPAVTGTQSALAGTANQVANVGGGSARPMAALGPAIQPDEVIQATYQRSGRPAIGAGARAGVGVADDIARQGAGLVDDAASITARTGGATGAAGRAAGTAAAAGRSTLSASALSGLGGGGGGIGLGGGAAGSGASGRAAGVLANITRQSLLKGAGVAGTGYMVSGIIDGMDLGGENSAADRILSGGILGGGLGAGGAIALGLGSGPVGWAALGGAALFGGAKLLWGDKETTPEKMRKSVDEVRSNIMEVGAMYGMGEDALEDVLLQYEMSTAMYLDNKDKEGLKAYMTTLTQQLPGMMLQQKQIADQKRQENMRYDRMIETQAAFAPIFEQQMARSSQANQYALTASNEAADFLQGTSPQLASLVRQTAAQDAASAERLQAAYAAQLAQAPGRAADMYDLEQRLAQQELLAQYAQPVG